MLALVNTVVSLFYYARYLAPMYFTTPPEQPIGLLSPWSTAAAVGSALAVVAAGVAAEPFVQSFGHALLLGS